MDARVTRSRLYRWFGMGKLSAAVRMKIAEERQLFESEGIHATTTFSGHVPGFTAGIAKQFHLGAFAVTDRRVIGTCGRSTVVDVPYDLAGDGPAMLRLEPDGLHVLWDLDRVHPACRGTMHLQFKETIGKADLARFPVRQITFRVDPDSVVRFLGNRRRLPRGHMNHPQDIAVGR
jgi:hypothetical protein